MIFLTLSVIIPLATYFLLPDFLEKAFRKKPAERWPLVAAGLCFIVSWHIPSPLIQGQQTQFLTHLVGGGIYTGFVWLYVKRHLRLEMPAWLELFSLFALVSALGAANELFELALYEARLTQLSPTDTWWDIFANTLGALLLWTGWRVTKRRA